RGRLGRGRLFAVTAATSVGPGKSCDDYREHGGQLRPPTDAGSHRGTSGTCRPAGGPGEGRSLSRLVSRTAGRLSLEIPPVGPEPGNNSPVGRPERRRAGGRSILFLRGMTRRRKSASGRGTGP